MSGADDERVIGKLMDDMRGVQSYGLRDGAGWSIGTAFIHGDGDGFSVIVQHRDDGWWITDLGGACGHLFYDNITVVDPIPLAYVRAVAEYHGLDLSEQFALSIHLDGEPDAFDVADFIKALAMIDATAAMCSPATAKSGSPRA